MKGQMRCVVWVLLLAVMLSALTGCAEFHPHNFGAWETLHEASCTQEGVKYRSCSCGEVETMDVPPLEHEEGEWVTTLEATMGASGRRELRCKHCGAVMLTEIIPALDPSMNAMPSKDRSYNINILTQRNIGYNNDPEELWFFRYMEYWFAQQGYDVDIQVVQSNDIEQTMSLCLNTDTLPDLMWGIELNNEEIVRYAIEEYMILEWTPYINEYLMPNLTKLMEAMPQSRMLSTAPNGGIYGLPYYNAALYSTGSYGVSERLYFRQSWLDQVGLENPTTKEELLNVLRAFKTQITDKTADKTDVPLVFADSFLEKYLWTCMGFYGTEPSRFGSNLMIKDGQIVLPAYTESYKEFVAIMKTMYDEGLIARDFFTYSGDSAGDLENAGTYGALAWYNLEYAGDQFADYVCANPIPMGDVQSAEDIHVSRPYSVYPNTIWASSRYEEPRILAMLIDFIYSEEGAWLYRYGPKQGEDPLNLVDGWYFDENGNVTTQMVASGVYTTMDDYCRSVLYPVDCVGLCPTVITSGTGAKMEFTDSVTGETFTCVDTIALSHDNNDGHWRLITIETWSDRATSIRLPDIYLNSDEMYEFLDYKNALNHWINSETVKFITGVRPISEIDEFWKELEQLCVKEYLEMANEGYADWMKATFD